MDLRRPRLHCLKDIKHGRKLLIGDVDGIQRLHGSVFINGCNRSHLLAEVTDPVVCQHVLVCRISRRLNEAVTDAPCIPPGDHCLYTGYSQGLCSVDVQYPRMGKGAPQYFCAEHTGQPDIDGVLCFSRYLDRTVNPGDAFSYYCFHYFRPFTLSMASMILL
ncbi:MAG: hypothetical protein A4E64_01048 [Syntrophorhabdus sp. PtaU1.Bin058]|nr:MAG: hypothetical protein A4E64_01048 [Syntrophorhabdus sp. PtaU1.Bin058]